jgi:hypothetical protein
MAEAQGKIVGLAFNGPEAGLRHWKVVSAEGIESALERTFNKMQSNGRHL